jgi:hypothetical protein
MKTATLAGLALAVSMAFATPAAAQESSFAPGDYWDVSSIDVLDGQIENYMDYLAGSWKRQQEFAKSKGYIKSYQVVANTYPRAGEPDLYLIVVYPKVPDAAELVRQQKEFEAFMKADARALSKQYADRGTMRKSLGAIQLQEVILK